MTQIPPSVTKDHPILLALLHNARCQDPLSVGLRGNNQNLCKHDCGNLATQ
jgi:hypothetical protein